MMAARVTFFGNFGTLNLGNECTLQAIVHNIRKYLPDAVVACICPRPDDTAVRHGIAASLMSDRYRKAAAGESPPRANSRGRGLRILRSLPMEIAQWIKAYRALAGTDALVMTGTGMLGNFGIHPLELHYEIVKWSLMAKLRGCKVLFVSVGSSRLRQPLSRWLVRTALSVADYRSYRDTFSKVYLSSIGVDTTRDPVYPDLAFSLPSPEAPGGAAGAARARVVGLGLMEYYGQGCSAADGEEIYREYVDRIATFAAWLLDRHYTVRLLVGDMAYDKRVRQDVIARLTRGAPSRHARIISEPAVSVEALLAQLAATDIVVATRFHNVLLALLLNKPVISIAYDRKNDAVMGGVGLAEYCQTIEELDVDRLVAQFVELERETATVKPYIADKAAEFRGALDEQYGVIFHETLRGVGRC